MVFSYFVMQIEEFVARNFFSFFFAPADTNGIKGEKRYENEITKLHTHQNKMPRNRAKKRGVKVEIFGSVTLCWKREAKRKKEKREKENPVSKKTPVSCWFSAAAIIKFL